MHISQPIPGRRSGMAILITLIPRQINTTIPLLVVDITREIVIEIIPRPGNTRAISLLDQPETVLVDFLEQERRIVASEVPSAMSGLVCPLKVVPAAGCLKLEKS